MTNRIDLDVLVGFVEEIQGYLPRIRKALDEGADSPLMEDAYRCAHTVKGSSALVGFSALSHLAYEIEKCLEEAISTVRLTATQRELLERSLITIEVYLERCSQSGLDVLNLDATELEVLTLSWQGAEAPVATEFRDALPVDPLPEPPTDAEEVSREAAEPDEQAVEEISPELIEVFSLEAEEHLRVISSLLPALQENPDNREHLQEIRRSAHTLKGSAAMVGYESIKRLAHRMEDLLDLMYEGSRPVTPEVIRLLFDTSDTLEDMAAGKAASGLSNLYQRYADQLTQSTSEATAVPPAVAQEATPETVPMEDLSAEEGDIADLSRKAGQFLRVPIDRLDDIVKLVSELVISRSEFEQRLGAYSKQLDELGLSTGRLSRTSNKLESQYEAKALGSNRLAGLPGFPAVPSTDLAYGFDSLEFDRYTDFHLLTRELSETSTDIRSVGNELGALNRDFESYLTRQTRLSSELQEKLMRLRMVPLATLANRLQRTVRNAASVTGKQARLIIDGGNTELDKTVLEEMSEPLLHLLRNAVDHGIEYPEARKALGKTEVGTVRVKAYTEGTQVVIRIDDDGAGIDSQRLRACLVEKGFASSAEEAARLSPAELHQFLFQPGFSTAHEVSEISGRGVGLDIVRSLVTRLKGTMAIETNEGRGTSFVIRLPLTLAVMRALLVRAGGQTFALPLGSVSQITRLEEGISSLIGNEPVVRLSGKVHPAMHLGRALKLKNPVDESVHRPPVIVLNVGDRQIALIVDSLVGGREIVVKNLGNHIRRIRGIAGATLMGDGSVVLIVNPGDLQSTQVTAYESSEMPTPPPTVRERRSDGHKRVMVVDDSPSVRRIVSVLLRNAGWQTLVAKDGVEALELLNQGEIPDAVVLDIEMPRMDGYELLSTMRASSLYRHIPVVMATSRAGDKHRKKAMDLGASAYLVKPYQEEVLIRTLEQLVAETVGA